MSTLVVEQPNYVPWPGYFDLVDRADVWVWYNDVQYTRRDWRNRNRVAGDSDPVWLAIPVRSRDHRNTAICDIEIDHRQPWVRKHLETLRHLYGRSPFFGPVFELMRRHLESKTQRLADLTIGLAEDICRYLEIGAVFERSSRLSGIEGAKQQRILSVCRQFRPSVYLSGPAARGYLDEQSFAREGIELQYIEYDYQDYPRGGQRRHGRLSILDPLFWIGPAETRALIRGRRPKDDADGK